MNLVIVGVGIGDPDLLTVRAVACLRRADFAVIGPGVSDAILALLPARCPRAPLDRFPASGDAALAVPPEAREVVVLTAGEPARLEHGLGRPAELVPALSPEALLETFAGLRVPPGLTVTSAGPDPAGLAGLAAALSATADVLVVRTSAAELTVVAQALAAARSPLHVVSEVATPRQRVVPTTPATLAQDGALLPGPLLVVAGASGAASWFRERPLFGKRIALTRPEGQADASLALFREAGAEAVSLPAIAICPPEDPEPLAEAVVHLASYDWVVFTSANGVERFLAALAAAGKDARAFGASRVACIGPETAKALARASLRADLVPRVHVGEGLAEELLAALGPGSAKVLLPRAKVARDVVPSALAAAGHAVDVVTAYETRPAVDTRTRAAALLSSGALDVVAFSSSSTATHFVSFVGAQALAPLTVASIGPVTTETLRHLGVRVDVTATEHTLQGLRDALHAHFKSLATKK